MYGLLGFMNIVTIVGARPQFIKAAVVSRALKSRAHIEERLIHTGQHYDNAMSRVFFDELAIPQPVCNLGIGGGSHGQNTGQMLEKIESVLLNERPDSVLVYGDTDSTLAGALAAVKLHIPVIHVEAGLRSYNRQMPEEINRVLTDHIADLLFAPTQRAVQNLSDEGISGKKVHLVGDVMNDAASFYAERAIVKSRILSKLYLVPKEYILATIHRQDNTDSRKRIATIIEGFSRANLPVILPLHPRTAKCLRKFGLTLPDSVQVIEPVGYLDMIMLEKNAALIVTDSGGVQKEAYFHRVFCLTLRNETEWVELVENDWNRIVAPESAEGIQKAIDSSIGKTGRDVQLYGEGDSGKLIANIIFDKFRAR